MFTSYGRNLNCDQKKNNSLKKKENIFSKKLRSAKI